MSEGDRRHHDEDIAPSHIPHVTANDPDLPRLVIQNVPENAVETG